MAQECHGPEYLGSYSRLVYDWLNAACPHPDNACAGPSRAPRAPLTPLTRLLASRGPRLARSRHGLRARPSPPRTDTRVDAPFRLPPFRYLNGALAATGSMHFSQCLWQSVPKNLDVILIEFAVNEGGNPHCDASMELIVRASSPRRFVPAASARPRFHSLPNWRVAHATRSELPRRWAGGIAFQVRRLLIHNPAITIIIVNWHDHW